MSCYPYVVPRSLISRRHLDPRWPLLHGADNRRSAATSIADAREQFVRSAAGIAADMFGPRGAYYGETVDRLGGVDRMPAGDRDARAGARCGSAHEDVMGDLHGSFPRGIPGMASARPPASTVVSARSRPERSGSRPAPRGPTAW